MHLSGHMHRNTAATAFQDPRYLRNEQYRDQSNLDARQALHDRFGTNPVRWFRWTFAHLDLPPAAEILEVGPLIQYLKSTRAGQSFVGPELNRCRQFFAFMLETEGAIRITKDTGLFVANRPKRAARRPLSVFVRVRPCSQKKPRVEP